MANYVFNSLYVKGDPEDVKRFFTTAKMTITETFIDWSIPSIHKELVTRTIDTDFSFRAFVRPPSENYDDYITSGGGSVQNWYHWNIDSWGTKWDAQDVHVDLDSAYASFTTAWSPPMPVFEAIIKQFPELSFTFSYEEEQGWGGELHAKDGVITYRTEWDIPESHADNVALGKECSCEYEDDDEYWYKDCPKAIEAAKESVDA